MSDYDLREMANWYYYSLWKDIGTLFDEIFH